MLDLASETVISIREAANRVPSFRPGKRTHTATIFRWIATGVNGVRLESARLGGRVVTSVEALQRFSNALDTARTSSGPNPIETPTPASRRRSAERAERELHQIGI